MYIFQQIEEIAVSNKDNRKQIAQFILDEKAEIADYSMEEVAKKTYSSKSTLSRFAKSLGFSGWVEFNKELAKEVLYFKEHFSDVDPNVPFTKEDDMASVIAKLAVLQTESIRDTVDQMKEEDIIAAGEILVRARHIAVFGMSPNSIVAELFKRKMETIGILVEVAPGDEGGMIAHSLNRDDCAIIVSYSGNNPSRRPMRYIKTLKDQNVKLIGITNQGTNYIREHIALCLTMSTRERLYSKIANYATEESLLFIFNVLFSYCFKKYYDYNYDYKVNNSRKLEYLRQTDIREMKEE